ncbi:MAG: class I SAM-dependent methyltransferase [Planctomycetota bacterium]
MTQALAHQPPAATGREQRDRALFDGIAEHYTRKDLHPSARIARQQRLLQTLAAAPLPRKPSILEAGCGAGFSARYLEGRFSRFAGIDYADNLIHAARRHNAVPNASFLTANIKQLDLEEQFDAVVMIGVLHHLDDMPAAVESLIRVLKPGGWLLANEPQPGNPMIRLARGMRKRIDRGYSDEQDQLSSGTLCQLYRDAGLEDVNTVPQGFISTPLAEVALEPTMITRPLAKLACRVDRGLERLGPGLLRRLSWNLVAVGRKP